MVLAQRGIDAKAARRAPGFTLSKRLLGNFVLVDFAEVLSVLKRFQASIAELKPQIVSANATIVDETHHVTPIRTDSVFTKQIFFPIAFAGGRREEGLQYAGGLVDYR